MALVKAPTTKTVEPFVTIAVTAPLNDTDPTGRDESGAEDAEGTTSPSRAPTNKKTKPALPKRITTPRAQGSTT